jgi:flagellar biosynthesis/type III secretory pathway protein FliH
VRPVNTILDRFRRAAAVPAAAGDDLARELAPLFAALDAIEGEQEKLRARAARAAERHRESARADAAEVEAAALERAEAARRAGELESRRAAVEESEALLAVAETEARRIRDAGSDRVGELVRDVVACVRSVST